MNEILQRDKLLEFEAFLPCKDKDVHMLGTCQLFTLPLVSRLVFERDAGSAKPRGPRDLQQVHERPH